MLDKIEEFIGQIKNSKIEKLMNESNVSEIRNMIQKGNFDTGDLSSLIQMAIEREDEDMVEMLLNYKPRHLNALTDALRQNNPVILELVFYASNFEQCKQALAFSVRNNNGFFEKILEWLDIENGYLIALQECANHGETQKAKDILEKASTPLNVSIITTMAADEDNEELVDVLIHQNGFNKEEAMEYLEDVGEMQNKQALSCLNRALSKKDKQILEKNTPIIEIFSPPTRL